MLQAQTRATGDRELQLRWERRMAEGRFSPVVAGVRRLTCFGRGDSTPYGFPLLRAPLPGESRAELLAGLAPEERWALARAARAVSAGRQVFAVARDRGVGEPLAGFDLAEPRDILILAPGPG